MIGAIAGDIIGSVFEFHPCKSKQFPLFDPRCPRLLSTSDAADDLPCVDLARRRPH